MRLSLFATAAVLIVSGCGESNDKTSTPQPSRNRSATDDRAAAERVVRQWVDEDDCSLMSDRYAAEGYASAAEGQRACKNEADPGLRKGEYDVASVEIAGRRAQVRLALEPAGERTYSLVKGGPFGWEIDGRSDKFRGAPGDVFLYRDSYELDGEPVNPRIEIEVTSIKDRARPNANRYVVRAIEKPGHRWVRARVRLKSLGTETFDFTLGDFKVVDTAGHRYEPDFVAFEPALGSGAVNLSEGDTVRGYLGFQVPDRGRIAEVRFAAAQSEPLVWQRR